MYTTKSEPWCKLHTLIIVNVSILILTNIPQIVNWGRLYVCREWVKRNSLYLLFSFAVHLKLVPRLKFFFKAIPKCKVILYSQMILLFPEWSHLCLLWWYIFSNATFLSQSVLAGTKIHVQFPPLIMKFFFWHNRICAITVFQTSALTWCTGKTHWDRVEREVGGGIGMGNTCISKADSCQCMTKTTTIL